MEQLLHPVDKSAWQLGISERKMWDLIRTGAVRSVVIGRRRLISSDALREYVSRLEGAA
jgi:excisionase family DNA binding protein